MTMLLIKLRVITFIPIALLGLLVFTATDVEGYASWCAINQTMFVLEESTAKFRANLTHSFTSSFQKTSPEYQYIFYVYYNGKNMTDEHLRWYDRSWENRTHISGHRYTNDQMYIQIEISNISMGDNGTYLLQFRGSLCLILFVMQIGLEPREAIEEDKAVYVYAHPHASLITRPLTNATMVWLLDGLSVNQTASFIQQDGLIWIPHIQRGMDGRNVTYRAIQDNGDISDVNYTLNVRYGPSQPLTLIPTRTQYYLVNGDVMPDITCTADCKPACSISWGKYSSDGTLSLGTVTTNDTGQYACAATRTNVKTIAQTVNIHVAEEQPWIIQISPQKAVYILSVGDTIPEITCTANCFPPCDVSWGIHSPNGRLMLGIVSKDTTGDYICTATRKGLKRRVERGVTIHVQDNTSFSIAIACLAAVQAMTTFGLGLCAFLIYRRTKQSPCQTCFNGIARKAPTQPIDNRSNLEGADNHGLEPYENLDTDTRQTDIDYEITITTEAGLETYENIQLSSSSS